MDFTPSEDHLLLADSLRRSLSKANPMTERLRHAFAPPYHDPALWRSLAELGVQGAFMTPESGGYGGSASDVAVIFEEIGRSLCAEPLLGALLAARLLENLSRADLLAGFLEGERRPALAVIEPGLAVTIGLIDTLATRADDGIILTGHKTAIYGAPGADDLYVVARFGAGLALFRLTEPQMRPMAMVDGGGTGDLVLHAAPAELIAEAIEPALEEALDLGRIALCAEALGAGDHLLALTTDYLSQRRQFGQALAEFQALRHRCVDLLVELEQMRSITISAVAAFETPDRARRVAMAKALIGRGAARLAEEAIQLHGGIGMTWDYAGSHYAKRLIMLDHQLGDRLDHLRRLGQLPPPTGG